jgi:acetoin utilization deacetylase AcuC-like enzyme
MSVRWVCDPVFLAHDPGPHHPESPWRYRAMLQVEPPPGARTSPAPRWATVDELARVHDPAWAARVLSGEVFDADPETPIGPRTAECVARASGAVLDAVDAALDAGEHSFVAVRPPGHHAERARGLGFCPIHHVAVGAAAARARGARVAVVDWDVHWGNGTTALLAGDPGLFAVSVHQADLFPVGGDAGDARPGVLHVPLGPDTDDDALLAAFDAEVMPRLRAFAPTLVLVSAGYDGHADDAMSSWKISAAGYAALTARVAGLGAPVVAVLEGGYDPASLRASVEATLEALCASPSSALTSPPSPPR